jgi:hypothetical protein
MAAVCIAIYIMALAFGAAQVIESVGERRNLAEQEFNDISDRATSSSVFLGFMSEAYRETIGDSLNASETLLSIIITGSDGEYAFERYPGSGIVWAGDSPRFRTGPGYPREPFTMFLRIEGQRNVTIKALYSFIDYDFIVNVLKNTLLAVLAALAIAFVTLMAEMYVMNRAVYSRLSAGGGSGEAKAAAKAGVREDGPGAPPPAREPRGLFSARGNVGWESYTHERLASELHRAASFEQDLVFFAAGFGGAGRINDALYRRFTDEAVSFFTTRDLIFEKGGSGVSVILPNSDIERGLALAEEFRGRALSKLPDSFEGKTGLCVGLSSRSGRLVEAGRLMLEADTALEKAMKDPASPIIAFKTDLEKYRKFIKNHPSGEPPALQGEPPAF